ncbi:MAG: hypothetical protein HQM09_12680 [Candidatus Riflebacteria bacterium]|nr:hypothetical protein [Candidatus Riflebacteria bacterium]
MVRIPEKLKENEELRIPEEMKKEIEILVSRKAEDSERILCFSVKKCYLYLYEENSPLCRMKYLGDKNLWGFAIYKYRTEVYSPSEFGFPSRTPWTQ